MEIHVNSSAISTLQYNETRQDLTVNFNSGRQYVYTPVSPEFFGKLRKATSKGRYFNNNIKNNEALTCLKKIT